MAHAPGPWEWHSLWTFRRQLRASGLGNETTRIIEVGGEPECEIFLSSEDDASLISKAWLIPELADALQSFIDMYTEIDKFVSADTIRVYEELCINAEGALARLRG